MASASLELLAFALTAQVIRWMVWAGLVALTGSLLVLVRSAWGQAEPLRKCIVLSLVAHCLIAIYATTVNIITGGVGSGGSPRPVAVALLSDGEYSAGMSQGTGDANAQPWNTFAGPAESMALAPAADAPRISDEASAPERRVESRPQLMLDEVVSAPRMSAEEPTAPSISTSNEPVRPATTAAKTAEPIEAPPVEGPAATTTSVSSADDVPPPPRVSPRDDEGTSGLPQRTQPEDNVPLVTLPPLDRQETAGAPANAASAAGAGVVAGGGILKPSPAADIAPASQQAPAVYQERFSPNRGLIAQQHGGSPQTEAAVGAALHFLARAQSADGRWNARRFEAGREVMINGHDRRGAGASADTGVTGLALLALMAAGNTHLEGEHAASVRHGLEFLLRSQGRDGNLFGAATTYEKMYCHAMAMFALSEDYAMTKDERLRDAVHRAVAYSVSAQHRETGGWRYQPGDSGDTSQLGWQVMALKSAELAGVRIPDETRAGMIKFLKSVASGRQGGLASYRPGQPASRPMTAEALACRQFLGMSPDNPAGREAADYVLQEPPGIGQANLYYWYYATLAMYQTQGPHWERWNAALQETLLRSQRTDGELTGSWDPDAAWGAYGGRVYCTALSALCLEVYYRFLPLHVETAQRTGR